MRIGVVRESKDQEFRVGLVPGGAATLAQLGHEVLVEAGAGSGSGFGDERYRDAGARIVSRDEAWSEPELVVKVKEPNTEEIGLLRPGQVIFTYLHLAAASETAAALFPVLAPMSEVAGRLAVQIGVTLLHRSQGGKGLLLGGVPGVMRGRVAVIGAGTVGINAVRTARALGAEVYVLDVDLKRLAYLYDIFQGELNTIFSNQANLARVVRGSDLLVGAVYVSGRRAPRLVTDAMVASMEPGSVVVDVAVDQGGCIETIRPTTHSSPTYLVHDVIHYGVTNMPGAVPRTSTSALTNTTFPYVCAIAEEGLEAALRAHPALASGVNLWRGEVVCEGVAEAMGVPCRNLAELMGGR
jgi:alanine dehydrogenase